MTTTYADADGLVRVYPADASGGKLGAGLVWAHGGGFAGGDLDMPEADWVARSLAARGVTVVSVDYRLVGDGCRYPAPSDDVLTAWRWTLDHTADLGIDPAGLAIGGASAGANLVTGAVLRMLGSGGRVAPGEAGPGPGGRGAPGEAGPGPGGRGAPGEAGRVSRPVSGVPDLDTRGAPRGATRSPGLASGVPDLDTRGAPRGATRSPGPVRGDTAAALPTQPPGLPAAVFLAYPTLLAVQPAPDAALRALLDANPAADRFDPERVRAMYEEYLGGPVDDAPLPAVPGRAAASDLAGFPPVLMINSEADELRVSGEVFAATLAESGVPLELFVEPGTEHGHLNRPDEPAASDSIERVVRWMAGLDTAASLPTRPPASATLTTLRTTEGISS